MDNEYIYDIADVCQKLNITSRTLRFYEEKGIIDSTKDGFSNRRKYTKQQIDNSYLLSFALFLSFFFFFFLFNILAALCSM